MKQYEGRRADHIRLQAFMLVRPRAVQFASEMGLNDIENVVQAMAAVLLAEDPDLVTCRRPNSPWLAMVH